MATAAGGIAAGLGAIGATMGEMSAVSSAIKGLNYYADMLAACDQASAKL